MADRIDQRRSSPGSVITGADFGINIIPCGYRTAVELVKSLSVRSQLRLFFIRTPEERCTLTVALDRREYFRVVPDGVANKPVGCGRIAGWSASLMKTARRIGLGFLSLGGISNQGKLPQAQPHLVSCSSAWTSVDSPSTGGSGQASAVNKIVH